MRVVVSALRGEIFAERGALMVPHPGVIVGLAAPVQFPDRRDPRSGGRQGIAKHPIATADNAT